jgi:hypothetical protein
MARSVNPRTASTLLLGLVASACHASSPAEGGTSAAACPSAWLETPVVGAPIAVPDGNGRLVLHAAAQGTQNYVCAAVAGDGGTGYAWSFTGPEATLTDCHGVTMGRHFSSDAGPPEWQLSDGSYVVAHKMAATSGDGRSVPWLLLGVDGHGGGGPMAEARYVQRVHTVGGVAPSAPCDVSRIGTSEKVGYTADYVFFAP